MLLLKRLKVCAVVVVLLFAFFQSDTAHANIRSEKFTGFDVSAGAPIPAVFGTMIGVNLGEIIRVSFGMGSMLYWLNYQANLKIFLFRSGFTPYIGGGYDYINGRAGSFFKYDLHFDRAWAPTLEAGLDWTLDSGFHMGGCFGFAYASGQSIVMPGLAIGWYF